MNFLQRLASESHAAGLDFLLIGGNAVIAYGSQRTTEDVDLLISEERLDSWREFLNARGFKPFVDHPNFVQFVAPVGALPLDLMLVSASTWEKMYAAREQRTLGTATFAVPSGLHIIALKLHALRYNPTRNTDWDDIDHPDSDLPNRRAPPGVSGNSEAVRKLLRICQNPPASFKNLTVHAGSTTGTSVFPSSLQIHRCGRRS